MIITLIAGIITGYVVSVPPLGPIAFALISKGFKNEFKEGMSIGFGSAFMDFIYALIAFGGISLFISLLPESFRRFYLENSYVIRIVLTYAGCVIVFIYGLRIMKSKITVEELEARASGRLEKAQHQAEGVKGFAQLHHVPVQDKSNHGGLFLMGIMLCLSSITLPASWIAIVGYIKGFGAIDSSFWGGILFSLGAFAGTAMWFYTLLKLITDNRSKINPKTINKLNVIAGYILIFLGIFLFGKATGSIFHLF
jgi:arginine exporter protein ArgO